MPTALQRLVDGLSRRLKCAVVLDDPNAQQQVYNSQYGPVDQSRRNRILSRAADARVMEYLLTFREPWPKWPVRVPAKPEIGIESRVYMAVHRENKLLGHLWIFDSEHTVDDKDMELIFSASESAGLILKRQHLFSDLERTRERELLRDLLSSDKSLSVRAADDVIASEFFPARSPVTALVVKPVHPGDAEPDQTVRSQIGRVLEDVRFDLTPGFALNLVRRDHGLLLISPLDPAVRSIGVTEIAAELQAQLSSSLESTVEGAGWRVLAGIGEERPALGDAATTYDQARHAVRVATVSPQFGSVASWSELGSYRLLARYPLDVLGPDDLHLAVSELARNDEAYALLHTLETYLDSACDAKATATALFIHRATLYYRLRRISEITGADLTSGDERLAIHLSLKLGRLIGVFGPGAGSAGVTR